MFSVSARKALAITLVTLMAVLVIPFSAFAADYLVVRGTITDIDYDSEGYIVSVNGEEQIFYVDYLSDVLDIGDVIKVYFDPSDPNTALKIALVATKRRAPESERHSHYSVTGVITDAGMSTITVLSNGRYRTFSKEDADVLDAPNGILLGDTVKIVYNPDDQQQALQIIMVAHGSSHSRRTADVISHYSVTGVVTDATMNSITLYANRKYRTFSKEDASITGVRDGILLGDTVRIVYHQDDPMSAVQIVMVRQGKNHNDDARSMTRQTSR